MVQLTQIFIIYICVSFAKGHTFFGNDHHRVQHQLSELPQIISHLITQNFGPAHPYSHGLYRPGIPGNGNNFGPSLFDYNRPSSIFGGNLFGSPDYTGNEGVFNPEESGEPLQQPNSGEDVQNIQIPQVSNGANFDLNSNPNSETVLPNEQNVDLTGQGIGGNIHVDVPNIEIPQIGEIVVGLDKKPVNGIIGSDLGAQAEDGTNVDLNKPGTTINAVGPIIGQLGQVGIPNNVDSNVNIEGNKHDVSSNISTSGQDNIKVILNSSSDSINDSNLHVNGPVDGVATDSKLEDTIKDIFKPDGQSNLNVESAEPKANVSGIPSPNISSSEMKVLDVSTNKDGKGAQNEGLTADDLQTDNSTSILKDESNQDSTLKTNQVASAGDNVDIKINKHKDISSIVFPDQLSEAKDKMQKQKNASQLSKLNDINGFNNGQVLYAVNIGSSIVPQNQGVYVSPSSSSNGQQVYVNSPSGTSEQYVPQNPSSTISNTVPNGNIASINANGGSTSGGYTLVNGPANGNSNSGQVPYYPPSSAGQSNTYYQVPSNPSQQSYYTVQLSNGQIALVPVNSGQYVQSNGQGQVIVLNNGQQYMPVQSTGQILYSNGQQLVPSNSQPMQGNNQYMTIGNGQQYVPSSSQPTQGNGQILVASNGQQYVQTSVQPIQGNGQGVVQGNGQQYVQASAQPIQSNGQVVVQGNGQQYVQASAQPFQGNGQVVVQGNGQQYVQASAQPIQSNGQVMVQGNGQQYVQANAQPTQGNGQVIIQGNGQHYVQSNGQPANGQFIILNNGQNYVPSGQVSMPWSQGPGQSNDQVYVPLSNQNTQSNVITVPAGSIVTVGGNSNSVPLMVFKDKEESSPKPSSSGDVDQDDKKDKNETSKPSFSDDDNDDEINQEKDEVVEDFKKNTIKDKQ